jgi:hypothetical protein
MSIDTTVKVGFDGSAVKGGLKNIGGMFGKFSKEVGTGAARKVGEFGTDLLGKAVEFAVQGATAIFDFAGDLKDLASLTGESAQELMILNEQLKLAGAESGESGKQLLTLSKGIYASAEAAKKGEKDDVWNIFDKLGLTLSDLMSMKPAEQIRSIFSAMSANKIPKDQANSFIETLFGGKGVLKYGKVFADGFAESRQTAMNNLGPLLKMTDKEILGYEAAGDEAGRLMNARMQLSSSFAKGLTGGNTGEIIASTLKMFFDSIGKAAEFMERAGAALRNTFEYIGQVGFGNTQDGCDIASAPSVCGTLRQRVLDFAAVVRTHNRCYGQHRGGSAFFIHHALRWEILLVVTVVNLSFGTITDVCCNLLWDGSPVSRHKCRQFRIERVNQTKVDDPERRYHRHSDFHGRAIRRVV